MSSTLAFPLEEMQQHIIAPDDSDFLDSEAESEGTPHPDDHLIESAVLEDLQSTPHRSSKIAHPTHGPAKLWPAHPLIRIHKRLWFTYFSGDLPAEDDLNAHDGMSAAWKNFDDDEIKKYVDPTETNPARLHWFNIDHDLVYLSFWFDWGPLNVAMFYRFCLHVHHMLTDDDMQDATLVLYTTDAPAQKANAALLATLYAMIIGKVSPADAFYPISQVEFRPFRDAGYGRADYNLSIQDVLYGVHRAINQNLLDLTTFNLDEYEKYEQVSNGDWNWITPNFIAFASPNDRNYVEALRVGEGRLPPSYSFRPPREDTLFGRTIRYFKNRGVKLVVRLNNPLYDRDAFRNENIDHCDMYFDDGSNPTDEILSEFIAKADKVIQDGGVVAVHCKAGLGRTGVLIGAYLAWKHGFSAGEAIGFMRFMRPGCVVGPQQHFMYQNSVEWIKWGVRDNAMKEAKQLIADERAKMEAAQAAAAAASAAGEAAARASVKRRAAGSEAAKGVEDDSFEAELNGHPTSRDDDHDDSLDEDDVEHAQVQKQARKKLNQDDDEEDEQRPRQKRKSDLVGAYTDLNGSGPVTPKAQRGTSRAIPASAAPGIKPAPCVGQPRKSPSPSRKRPAIQAPATVARLELNSKRYPMATRSFASHLMLSTSSTTSSSSGSHHATVVHVDAVSDHDDDERGDKVHTTANGDGAAPGTLVESRINIIPGSTTPKTSPKAAVLNLTPSPVARVGGFERVRSNTIATPMISTPMRGSSRLATVVTEPSPVQEMLRASPNVRETYGLKDPSHRSPSASPSPSPSPSPSRSSPGSPAAGRTAGSRHASPVATVKDMLSGIFQAHLQPQPEAAEPNPFKVEPSEPKGVAVADENAMQVQGQIRAPLSAELHRLPKVLRSVRSKPALNGGNSVAVSAGARVATTTTTTATTTTATVRTRPTVARPAVSARSVSAKLAPSSSTTAAGVARLRPQKSVAELRSKSRPTPAPSATTATASAGGATTNWRTVSSSSSASNSSTTATVTSGSANANSRPASRLTAPTTASAARAAANAAKRTGLAPPRPAQPGRKVSAALQRAPIPSTLAKPGSALRRRRSSTGETGLDVVA